MHYPSVTFKAQPILALPLTVGLPAALLSAPLLPGPPPCTVTYILQTPVGTSGDPSHVDSTVPVKSPACQKALYFWVHGTDLPLVYSRIPPQ